MLAFFSFTIVIMHLKNEVAHRSSLVGVTMIWLLLMESNHVNEIIIIVLSPIKGMHNDWHNNILYGIINHAFESDIIQKIDNAAQVEYFPSCEISITNAGIHSTITYITVHLLAITLYASTAYHITLYRMPSLFKHENKSNMFLQAKYIATLISAQYVAHTC